MGHYPLHVGSAGTVHLMRKDWAAAAKAYNAVVALQDMKHDPYARVGLATIQLYSMPHQQMVMLLPSLIYQPLSCTQCDTLAGSPAELQLGKLRGLACIDSGQRLLICGAQVLLCSRTTPKSSAHAHLSHACLRGLTRVDSRAQEENAQKIAKHLFYALETYQIVLQKDSGTTISMTLNVTLLSCCDLHSARAQPCRPTDSVHCKPNSSHNPLQRPI